MENTGRCEITGNPCGTDTWIEGHDCLCGACQHWLELADYQRTEREDQLREMKEQVGQVLSPEDY